MGRNEQGQQHDDDQSPHPKDMVGNIGLVGEQYTDAQAGRDQGKDGVFAQRKRKRKVNDARVQQ